MCLRAFLQRLNNTLSQLQEQTRQRIESYHVTKDKFRKLYVPKSKDYAGIDSH